MSKKVLIILTILIIIIILFVIVWVRLIPVNKINFISESDNILSDVLCIYPVKVAGSSMEPVFREGETVNFSKCFGTDNLQEDTIIIFRKGSPMKIGVIREIVIGESGIYYKVSPEARELDVSDVFPEDIVAVYLEDALNQ